MIIAKKTNSKKTYLFDFTPLFDYKKKYMKFICFSNDIRRIYFTITTLFLGIINLYSADRYLIKSGDWNSSSNWSATSGGNVEASVPTSSAAGAQTIKNKTYSNLALSVSATKTFTETTTIGNDISCSKPMLI